MVQMVEASLLSSCSSDVKFSQVPTCLHLTGAAWDHNQLVEFVHSEYSSWTHVRNQCIIYFSWFLCFKYSSSTRALNLIVGGKKTLAMELSRNELDRNETSSSWSRTWRVKLLDRAWVECRTSNYCSQTQFKKFVDSIHFDDNPKTNLSSWIQLIS